LPKDVHRRRQRAIDDVRNDVTAARHIPHQGTVRQEGLDCAGSRFYLIGPGAIGVWAWAIRWWRVDDRKEIPMADRIELEPAGDGERWRLRTPRKDLEGDVGSRLVVKDEDAEGHVAARFSFEPAGEDESGAQLFRMEGEGDVEGHVLARGPEVAARDVEGHVFAFISLEPTGEEEDGDPVFRMRTDGGDVEGHVAR
jgi:hypothetical protein